MNAITEGEECKGDSPKMKEDRLKHPVPLSSSFVHKLYAMLEDENIRHLIWWLPTHSSFVLIPNEEFSRVLSNYFKHTNIASFVRQLNMYGFHKINDTGDNEKKKQDSKPGPLLWEFKHSSGWFKKGQFEQLKKIKRRSSNNLATQKEVHDVKKQQSVIPSSVLPEEMPSFLPPHVLPPRSPADFDTEKPEFFERHPSAGSQVPLPDPYPKMYELHGALQELRREHDILRHNYELVTEDLKNTNYDMVVFLDLFKSTISERCSTPPNCNTSSHLPPLNSLEQDVEEFKTKLIQRSSAREVELKNYINVTNFPKSYPPPQPNGPHPPPPAHPLHVLKNDIRYTSSRARNSSYFDPLQPAAGSPSRVASAEIVGVDSGEFGPRQKMAKTNSSRPASPVVKVEDQYSLERPPRSVPEEYTPLRPGEQKNASSSNLYALLNHGSRRGSQAQ